MTCKTCKKTHHSLLHTEEEKPKEVKNHVAQAPTTALLATAIIKVKANNGSYQFLRALVDPGSEASFITEEAAQSLGLPRQKR